ncbi:TIR domain-containing protein [Curtobacterium sp. BH-2-1-1]|uniref:TIR domain-containing protein n=1 Tax=Curtobacterium sp. BH-2-1-1 TaxID=1905847 RepID=UPI0015E178C8|nr:TIR domain-containing protein [Curtobacterium sp. BH-2-1-1]
MARVDPLQNAIAAYAADNWNDSNWRALGRETGTSDIISRHPRLYRSLGFGDDDYPDAAIEVVGQLFASEAVEDESGEAGRMELFADSMPDLVTWVQEHAPTRTRKLFKDYLQSRDQSEIPAAWRDTSAFDEEDEEWEARARFAQWRDRDPRPDPVLPWVVTESTPSANPSPAAESTPLETLSPADAAEQPDSIFIVHGHDDAALNSIRIFVHKHTGIMPTSLAEEAGRGQTIIEKFETYGDATSFVIVLLTPDDVGQTIGNHQAGTEPNPRARQNVVLELGYFIGKIGRKNVVVVDADVERPSDLAGLSYVEYPGLNWKDALRTELVAAGLIQG